MEDYIAPKIIMADPETMKRLAEVYFSTEEVPTPAGLALALGFSTAQVMVNALSLVDKTISDYSRHVLAQIITRLEDEMSRRALAKQIDVAMTKFILSARLAMSEKRETTITENSNKTIKIITASSEPVDAVELDEVLRLETALTQQTAAELAAIDGSGIGKNVKDPNKKALDIEDIL